MTHDVRKRNNVKVLGEGTVPMLFAHGFGCDQNMWRFMVPAFEKDYQIILFDYVGHGKSDVRSYRPERYQDLNGYAQDILDICHALDLRDVVLVGHSVSAVIGLLAAIKERDRFRSLIMIGPSPRYINEEPDYVGGFSREDIVGLLETMEKNYIGWATSLAPQIMGSPGQPELAEELKDSFCSTDPLIARQFAEATFLSDNRHDLAKLRVPSLILQCSEDIIAPMEVGRYMAEHVPQSTLHVLSATGHCPHMSAPEETIAAMKSFLQPQ